jgi:hypothetical protein
MRSPSTIGPVSSPGLAQRRICDGDYPEAGAADDAAAAVDPRRLADVPAIAEQGPDRRHGLLRLHVHPVGQQPGRQRLSRAGWMSDEPRVAFTTLAMNAGLSSAASRGRPVCPLPTRIVLSYLMLWPQRSRAQSPAAREVPTRLVSMGYGQRGRCWSPRYRACRRDVPRDLLRPSHVPVNGPIPSSDGMCISRPSTSCSLCPIQDLRSSAGLPG